MSKPVKLTYFKDTGKYYSEGVYYTNRQYIYQIVDEVKQLLVHPGINGLWREGFIHIEADSAGPAHLLKV